MPFGEKISNTLHCLNLDTLQWNTPTCTGSLPDPVYGCVSEGGGGMGVFEGRRLAIRYTD